MFKITDGKGFWLKFDNGYTLSVQFGFGNYCDNYNNREFMIGTTKSPESTTAELGCWNAKGEWYSLDDGDVKGYVGMTEFMEIANKIAALD